ncbi:MAG: hypothetical protein WBM50_20515 [Acidimicrobiales bacterium]
MFVVGIILTVTGVIALVHNVLRTNGRLPDSLRNDTLSPRAELIVSVGLIVVGVVLLMEGA